MAPFRNYFNFKTYAACILNCGSSRKESILKLQPAKKKYPRMNSPHPHNWNIGVLHGNPFLWTYLDPLAIVIHIILHQCTMSTSSPEKSSIILMSFTLTRILTRSWSTKTSKKNILLIHASEIPRPPTQTCMNPVVNKGIFSRPQLVIFPPDFWFASAASHLCWVKTSQKPRQCGYVQGVGWRLNPRHQGGWGSLDWGIKQCQNVWQV